MLSQEFISFALRLTAAAVLAGLIGFERDVHGRAAGLRTNMLISLGAACFFILAGSLAQVNAPFDPYRMPAQVISGIGFLGAGAILKNQFSVRGLTTAATIWISAAIGLSCGAEQYRLAVLVTVIALFCLIALEYVEQRFSRDFFRFCIIETGSAIEVARIYSVVDIPMLAVLSHETEVDYERKRKTVRFEVRLRDKDEHADVITLIEQNMKEMKVPIFSIALKKQ